MSARSRERWMRTALLGQLWMAYKNLRAASEAKHLTAATRARAAKIADETYALIKQVTGETTEPTELSAKKGT